MTTSYDRRTAAETSVPEETKKKLLDAAEMAEHQFKAGVALIQEARASLAAAKAETMKLPSREKNMFHPSGPRESLGDYVRSLIEEIDNTKILKKDHLAAWFAEFVSEIKAHLKDL